MEFHLVLPSGRWEDIRTASLIGWGEVWRRQGVNGTWPCPHITHQHTVGDGGVVETVPLSGLRDKHVLVCSDNVATVFYINHQGGTRSLAALQVAYNLLVWAQSNLLSICAVYLPGRLNGVADALSRGKVCQEEWRLCPDTME